MNNLIQPILCANRADFQIVLPIVEHNRVDGQNLFKNIFVIYHSRGLQAFIALETESLEIISQVIAPRLLLLDSVEILENIEFEVHFVVSSDIIYVRDTTVFLDLLQNLLVHVSHHLPVVGSWSNNSAHDVLLDFLSFVKIDQAWSRRQKKKQELNSKIFFLLYWLSFFLYFGRWRWIKKWLPLL